MEENCFWNTCIWEAFWDNWNQNATWFRSLKQPQNTLGTAPPSDETELTEGDVAGVSARSLESVGAVTDGAATWGVFPVLSLMESSFAGSMEGVTPKQQTLKAM